MPWISLLPLSCFLANPAQNQLQSPLFLNSGHRKSHDPQYLLLPASGLSGGRQCAAAAPAGDVVAARQRADVCHLRRG